MSIGHAAGLSRRLSETDDGESDGTVAIALPEGDGEVEWRIVASVRIDGHQYDWIAGPYAGEKGACAEWEIAIPAEARMVDEQLDYLSDLTVYVEVSDAAGAEASVSAGYARVAFEADAEPLVLTRAQAEELAPGDAWGEGAEPRVEVVERASLSPIDVPVYDGAVSHDGEVDG